MEGQITRKDIIADDAISWGADYAKALDLAIGKNKEFVTAIVSLSEANNRLRGSFNQAEFVENQKRVNAANNEAIGIWKEQIQLENNLISTKKKVELASEGTNRALVKERLELALINKEIKQEQLERLGLVSAYTKLNNARTEAKNKLRDLIASEQASTTEIKKATVEFDRLDAKVRKADRAVGDFSKNVGNYKSAFSGIKDIFGAFGLVGGITAFATITKDIFNTTKELQSLDLALKSVTGSQENFNAQQTFLSTIAEKYGLEIKNLTKQYTAFYVAAKDKLAAQEIQDLFENIAKSGSALGLSNETLERSFVAVNQMLSKGTVASEELRGQLAEALPGAVQAMTKAVQILHPEIKNLTEKGLFEMIKSGKILASEVLPETARQLVILTGADKAQGMETLTKSTNRLSNEWVEFVRVLNESESSNIFSSVWSVFIGGARGALNIMGRVISSWNQLQGAAKTQGQKDGTNIFNEILKESVKPLTAKEKKDIQNKIAEIDKALSALPKDARKAFMGERDALAKRLVDADANIVINALKNDAEKNLNRLTKEYNDLDRKTRQIANASNLSKQEKEDFIAKGVDPRRKEELIREINQEAQIRREAKARLKPSREVEGTTATETDAERKKREAAEKKAAAEALKNKREELAAKKRIYDADYELKKQSLEREIKLTDEVAKDEKESDDVRIAALELSQKKQIELTDLTKQKLLDADKFSLENEKLLNDEKEKIRIEAKNKIIDIENKTADEIEKINQFDSKVFEANLKEGVTKIEIAMNEELAAEEEKFKRLQELGFKNDQEREQAIREHEENIFNIKKEFAIATAKLQITNLEAELSAFKLQSDGSKESNAIILETEKKISAAKLKLKETEVDTFDKGEKKKVLSAKEQAILILEISADMTGALTDLGNAFSQGRIQKIEDEINKNNEYYDKQLELAGNDQRQKDLIEKERDKKNDELEKKKRKEQHKQAVFNKAAAVAQASISTALAILNALNTQPFLPLGPIMATVAGALGAIQIGAILATPIPKYKHGRKGGKGEIAEVGDGFVSEVITGGDGSNPRITPNKPTLTYLNPGDIVHKSVEDYNRYVRASILNKFSNDNERVSNFQEHNVFQNNNDKLLKEMQLTRKAIENNKNTTIVNLPKMDINHEIWKMKNKTWS